MSDKSTYKHPDMGEGYWIAATMYFHNKIAVVDTDKEVSTTIDFKV